MLEFLFQINFFQITLLNFSIVFLELLFTNLKGYSKYRGLNLSNIHLLLAIGISFTPFISRFLYKIAGNLTPTPQGIIDNIWSALIIYGVVSLFIFDKEKSADLIQEDFFLEFSARTSKYIEFIRQESIKHSADSLLVATVLFYEIKQRPQIIRFLERLFVLISKKETTQGVMQYKTNKLISDHQSISFAIEKYFYNTEEIHTRPDLLIKLLQKYNPSIKYASEVLNLYYGFRKSIHH